ncbi:sugar phosphate nucleotidyltransferase [soil metagenome]
MRAVILAGGKGTRLRPFTTILPKPLVPVGDRPVLELIIRQLGRRGFREIDLCVGHLGNLIRAYFDEGSGVPGGVSLRYVWEDEPLGTAGALHLIEEPTEPFLVMNGDILTTLDYRSLMRFHNAHDAALTIASHRQDVPISLGVIESQNGVVTDYIEKPTLKYEVSMGVYVYSPRALEHIPPGPFDFPDVVLALIDAGEAVRTYQFEGEWFDIGTAGEHERALSRFADEPEMFERS